MTPIFPVWEAVRLAVITIGLGVLYVYLRTHSPYRRGNTRDAKVKDLLVLLGSVVAVYAALLDRLREDIHQFSWSRWMYVFVVIPPIGLVVIAICTVIGTVIADQRKRRGERHDK